MIERIDKGTRLSRAVIHNGTVYLAGLTADDRQKDAEGQTREILAKASAMLAKAGTDKSRLLTATVWLRDMDDFGKMNAEWELWIDKNEPPARATVESKLALPDILVEIQFTAALDEKPGI